MLDAVNRGLVERIVVAKLDRLTRSVRDLDELINLFAKHAVALVSIGETLDTSTATGRMMVNLLGMISQWEREAIGERTADGAGSQAATAHGLRYDTFRLCPRRRCPDSRADGKGCAR